MTHGDLGTDEEEHAAPPGPGAYLHPRAGITKLGQFRWFGPLGELDHIGPVHCETDERRWRGHRHRLVAQHDRRPGQR